LRRLVDLGENDGNNTTKYYDVKITVMIKHEIGVNRKVYHTSYAAMVPKGTSGIFFYILKARRESDYGRWADY
jgi:hypothetical protein